MNPLLLPPRLLLRALDDLHTIAVAAARLEEVERRLDARLAAVLELGELVDGRLEEFDDRAAAVLAQGERLEAAAREVADRGAQLAAALPVMQKAVDMAVPLEGAVERLGRIVDRLPQVPQRRRAPAAAK